ncbi:hypothetical protein BOTBODRAFT_369322 [Botryobasidium botryosum FD-172 SS1]|uniref:Uncharacterized protein n=1 Tax=Botryobasidium botryosum (strain FD-172 SS1) TaxID=930990 RepID=A0A067MNN3_BOTB1|nr:hypothetical protein BOTBODRAFT_369322 [Botryobasidium botryosum FD-172 SS1]
MMGRAKAHAGLYTPCPAPPRICRSCTAPASFGLVWLAVLGPLPLPARAKPSPVAQRRMCRALLPGQSPPTPRKGYRALLHKPEINIDSGAADLIQHQYSAPSPPRRPSVHLSLPDTSTPTRANALQTSGLSSAPGVLFRHACLPRQRIPESGRSESWQRLGTRHWVTEQRTPAGLPISPTQPLPNCSMKAPGASSGHPCWRRD